MTPTTEAQLAEAIRDAAGPVTIRGGGTRTVGSIASAVLDTGALRGITLYEPGALTLVAQAGTPLAEIEATLAEAGQRLAFEPGDWGPILGRAGVSTIGGVVAANASGPRRVQAGACRDALIGIRMVDGTGMGIRNGGRVMKNVTGYDLVKLSAGSRGVLGVLTEVALKTAPLPEAEATLALPDLPPAKAVAALSSALSSPYDVTGAAVAGGAALLRIEGLAASVAYRAAALQARLGGRIESDRAASRALWAGLRDLTPLVGRAGDLWRIVLAPSDAPKVLAGLDPDATLVDWGGGLIWTLAPPGAPPALPPYRGHAACWRGAGARVLAPQNDGTAALSRALKQRFDPRGILNPGLI